MSIANERLRAWLDVAVRDLRVVERLATASPPEVEAAAFHLQQAVEKLVKLLVAAEGQEPPRTHNLRYLLNLLPQDHPFRDHLSGFEHLSPFATVARYWGTIDPEAELHWPSADDLMASHADLSALVVRLDDWLRHGRLSGPPALP